LMTYTRPFRRTTRQSLSRFLSERRELRTFMTLTLFGPKGPAKRRGNYSAVPPLSTAQKPCFSGIFRAPVA
jgi:hypothetical protein